VIIKDPTTP